ncbi:MAG: tetratricopeptide repeat protein [Lunatimonas sp.]|uniref:tetratricopeptide repeat protein n=1 Tax=Lunatimonas sp. TaxID=2060141 RepID=UPI00263A9C7D|nr:tetratricopeptide repeat protein [Lunatimonas sp.]MCC5938723.1 tetratricopeptide repeat protein [Lunatimonas sp.]
MSIRTTLYTAWYITFLVILLASATETVAQQLSKKERKAQEREILASRLFVEGQKYMMLEDFDRAYFYFDKSRTYNPSEAAVYFKMSEILTRANQLEKALDLANKAVEMDGSNKYYKLMIAEIYSKQKKPQEAAEVLRSLMDSDGDNQHYILELASLYLASQEFDKALEALEQAEEYYGVVEQLTAQKQRIYLRKNDLASAVEEGQKLIDAHPGNATYVLALVEILFNNNRVEQAMDAVRQSLTNYPDQPELFMAMYTLHKEKKQLPLANDYLRKAFAHPDLEVEMKVRVFVEILQELKTEARDNLLAELANSLSELHPKHPAVTGALGDFEQAKGNKKEALALYKASIAESPDNESVLQAAINLMFEQQVDFADIEVITALAVEEFPKRPDFWFFDGTAKLALKKYAESRESLEKALEINQQNNRQLEMMALGQLGDVYHSLDKKEEAFQAYEKVLEINPNNEHILNNYAYFLSLERKDLDKAKRMSEKLVARFPKNATYLDTHAWVLFQLGQYEDAKKYMEKALEYQQEPSGVMYEHFGDILYKLGEENEALAYWQKAEGLDETSKFLSEKIKHKRYYE